MTPPREQYPSVVEQKMARCVHFNGIGNPTCRAGVRYDDVRVDHAPIPYTSRGRDYTAIRSLPCNVNLNHCGAACERQEFMTREQAEREEAEQRAEFEHIMTARRLVVEATANAGGAGHVTCPKCGGRLGYSQAASNGHVWAKCETLNCLGWME